MDDDNAMNPMWKRDFPYESAGEDEVTRREFARFLVAGAGAMVLVGLVAPVAMQGGLAMTDAAASAFVQPEPLIAPFLQGQAVATLKITQGGQPLAEVPLVALEPVEEAGFFGRAWDAMRLWIK